MRNRFADHADGLAQAAEGRHARLHARLHILAMLIFTGCLNAVQPALAQGPTHEVVGMSDGDICPAPLPAFETIPETEREAMRAETGRRLRNDWAGLCRYRAANAALKHAPTAVFIGDSITEFWGAAAPELFSDSTLNRGIGAQTSPQMLVRFQQDVIALHPRVVHIMAGTNDIAGNTGPSRPDDFRNNIRAMVELAKTHGIMVVLGAIPPNASFYWRPEMRPAPRIAELNAWLKDYADAQGLVFVDYEKAMIGPGGELRADLTEDGVHPDVDGYAVMTPLARAALDRALARAARPGA